MENSLSIFQKHICSSISEIGHSGICYHQIISKCQTIQGWIEGETIDISIQAKAFKVYKKGRYYFIEYDLV